MGCTGETSGEVRAPPELVHNLGFAGNTIMPGEHTDDWLRAIHGFYSYSSVVGSNITLNNKTKKDRQTAGLYNSPFA